MNGFDGSIGECRPWYHLLITARRELGREAYRLIRISTDSVATPVKMSFEAIIMRLPFPTDEVNFWIMAMRTLESETVAVLGGQRLAIDENRKKYGITEDEAITLKGVLFRRKGKGTLERWLRILLRIGELD